MYPDEPIIGFKNNRSLKSHLVTPALADINEADRCEPYDGKIPPSQ